MMPLRPFSFRMVISITRLVVHGKTISSWDEEYVRDLSMALESFSQAALPGEHVLELLPFLKYVPGAAAKSKDFVKKYKPYVLAVHEKPYAEVKAQMVLFAPIIATQWNDDVSLGQDAGSASPSVTREIIDRIRSEHGGTEAEEAHDQTGRSVAFSAYAGMSTLSYPVYLTVSAQYCAGSVDTVSALLLVRVIRCDSDRIIDIWRDRILSTSDGTLSRGTKKSSSRTPYRGWFPSTT